MNMPTFDTWIDFCNSWNISPLAGKEIYKWWRRYFNPECYKQFFEGAAKPELCAVTKTCNNCKHGPLNDCKNIIICHLEQHNMVGNIPLWELVENDNSTTQNQKICSSCKGTKVDPSSAIGLPWRCFTCKGTGIMQNE
jgi:hypothetical protein